MRTYRRHAGGAAEHRHRAARRQTFSLSEVVLKHRQRAWRAPTLLQNLPNKRILGGFTSFSKNEGTDLLIFFKWFESENEDEEGKGVAETVAYETQDVRNSTNFTTCL